MEVYGLKEKLGFSNGPIKVFYGEYVDTFKYWFEKNGGKFHSYIGWYFPSEVEVPEITPYKINIVTLEWEDVVKPDGKLKPAARIKEIIEKEIK